MDTENLRKLGDAADENGEYDLAIFYYRQVLEIEPYDYELAKELGATLLLQSNFQAAAQVYSAAIARMESQQEAGTIVGNMHISLAEAYLKLHKFKEAQEQLEIASRTNATLTSLYDGWGNLYEATKEYDKALTAYQEFSRLLPDNHDGYLRQARIHQKLKQYDLAAELLEISKSLDPQDYWVEIALGNLAMAVEDYFVALSHYKIAQELDPRKPAVVFSMGRAYLMMEDYAHAREMFSLSLEHRPNNTDAMHGLAQVEIAEGNFQEATALLKSAIVINPANYSYYVVLSQTQVAAGKRWDALRTTWQSRKYYPA